VTGLTPRCDRAPAHSMRAKNRRVCAGDFPSADNGTRGKHHVQTHQTVCQEPPTAQAAKAAAGGRGFGRGRHLFIAGTTLDRRRSASRLERDDFSSNRHPALSFCLSMISGQTLRVCPEGKPVPTPHQVRGRLFPDHALTSAGRCWD